MNEPISRRSAILRMLAAVSTAEVLAWEGSGKGRVRWSALPSKIVPGERIGDVVLGMNEAQVMARLGGPCKTQHFTAKDRADMLEVFTYLNETMGDNYTEKDLLPVSTWLIYDRLGLDVKIEEGRVCAINAYTGVLSGYQKTVKNSFLAGRIPSGAAALQTLSDVQAKFGQPDDMGGSEYAPIPDRFLRYSQGISFSGRAHDGLVASITVTEREVS